MRRRDTAMERQVQILRLTFRPEKRAVFVDWVRGLADRKAEVIAAVDGEKIRIETLFEDGSGAVYMYQVADDLAFATAALQASTAKVDEEARAMFTECVAEVTLLPPLLHIDRL
jgi:hypothetical protein